jgi:hypothetical protein
MSITDEEDHDLVVRLIRTTFGHLDVSRFPIPAKDILRRSYAFTDGATVP